jgi:hypothetical protein
VTSRGKWPNMDKIATGNGNFLFKFASHPPYNREATAH